MRHNLAVQRAVLPAFKRSYTRADKPARTEPADADDTDADPVDDPADDDSELERQLGTLVARQVETVRADLIDRTMASVEKSIQKMLKPNRSKLPGMGDGDDQRPVRRPAPSGIRVTPSEEIRYRMLPESERLWRKPADDHYMAEWFRALLRNDYPAMMRANDELTKLQRADILEGTTTAVSGLSQGTGGHLMPLPFSTLIVRARNKRAKIRSISTIYTSDSLTLRVPVSAVATAAMAAEGGVAAQGEPAITPILFAKKKMQANFEMSEEMLADSAFNLVSFLSERAGSAFGALEDVEICVASGTPTVSTALSSISDTAEAVSTVLSYGDVVHLFYTLPEQYQADSVWLADSLTCELLSTIRATGGMPILNGIMGPANVIGQESTVRGVVGTIFGRPVYNVPLAAGSLFIADMSFYGILDGGGITVKQSDSILWAADSVAIRFTTRFDGNVMLPAAFRKMIGFLTAGT